MSMRSFTDASENSAINKDDLKQFKARKNGHIS